MGGALETRDRQSLSWSKFEAEAIVCVSQECQVGIQVLKQPFD